MFLFFNNQFSNEKRSIFVSHTCTHSIYLYIKLISINFPCKCSEIYPTINLIAVQYGYDGRYSQQQIDSSVACEYLNIFQIRIAMKSANAEVYLQWKFVCVNVGLYFYLSYKYNRYIYLHIFVAILLAQEWNIVLQ